MIFIIDIYCKVWNIVTDDNTTNSKAWVLVLPVER